jgi:uncharacterized protein YecT (DUF1311 family)
MDARSLVVALSVLLVPGAALSQSDAVHSGSGSGKPSAAWMLQYQGKSTNEFIWDKRAGTLVNTRVPAMLSDFLLAALGGPPDPVVVAGNRYVSVSACRPHSCTEKGFLWVDTQTGIALGAYQVPDTLQLGSNSVSADTIPRPARLALIAWLTERELRTDSVEFIDRTGRRIALDAANFSATERFQPPSTGPAFDCKLAASDIENAICNDKPLSAQDLALGELYKSIRLGSGTTIAQGQLQILQRNWLKDRTRECAHSSSMVACLNDQYRAQHDRLNNWVPTLPRRQ